MMNAKYSGMELWLWFIPVFLLFVVYFFAINNVRSQNRQHPETPADLAKKRYGLGEITKEKVEEMKKIIG